MFMKKIRELIKNKYIIIAIAIVIGAFIGLFTFVLQNKRMEDISVKSKVNTSSKDNDNFNETEINNPSKDNDNSFELEKEENTNESIPYLYSIFLHVKGNCFPNEDLWYKEGFFHFYITPEYQILGANSFFSYKELKPYNEEIENKPILNVEKLESEMIIKEHNEIIELNEEEKIFLKKLLENSVYNLDINSLKNKKKMEYNTILDTLKNEKEMEYTVLDYQQDKVFIGGNKDYSSDLDAFIYAFVFQNKEYLKYTEENHNIKNYIKDKEYKEVDIEDEFIEELYTKVVDSNTPLDSYVEEKLTNNTIITLTLQQMEKDKKYTLVSTMDKIPYTTIYSFSNEDFEQYAKRIFGQNVQYKFEDYERTTGCSDYDYSKNDNYLYVTYGNGCDVPEQFIGELSYAYETENKLVLIEKSLFFTEGSSSDYNSYFRSPIKEDINSGIYTGLHNRLLLGKNFGGLYNEKGKHGISKKFDNFTTYYSYTFTKDSDGNYYYTDFSKLN